MLPKFRRLARSVPISHDGLLMKSIMLPRLNSLRRHRQAVLDVLMALAQHLQIHRQHQRAAFRRHGALDQFLDEAAILHDVELKPEWLVDIFRHVLDRIDRHRAQRIRDAGGLRGAAGMNLAVAVLHAGRAHRRQDQRQVRFLTEDGGREIALRDIDQNPLAKLDRLQVVVVGAVCLLGIGAAIDIVEERLRHATLVNLAQILDAGDAIHRHSGPSCVASSDSSG